MGLLPKYNFTMEYIPPFNESELPYEDEFGFDDWTNGDFDLTFCHQKLSGRNPTCLSNRRYMNNYCGQYNRKYGTAICYDCRWKYQAGIAYKAKTVYPIRYAIAYSNPAFDKMRCGMIQSEDVQLLVVSVATPIA